METTYFYLAASGLLTVLMWTPYILSRIFVWGLPTFLNNYPTNFPAEEPVPPLWAQRAKRAHLNTVETLAAFIAVVLAASVIAPESAHESIGQWASVFFLARVAYAVVYIAGVPFLRTPTYLVSWVAILMIGFQSIS